MKKMGLDFGLKRIGIAFSDILGILASPYEVYHRTNYNDDLEHVAKLIKDNSVDVLVCGMPYEMSGNRGEIANKTTEFIENLKKKIDIKVEFVDERLSSYEAEEYLKKTIKSWEKRKAMLDSVSASIILQTYLDSKN